MDTNVPPDIRDLHDQLDAAERDAKALVAGLSQNQGIRRARDGSWCIAECLDHLATANRVYLRAMQEAATRARTRGSYRTRPAIPGWVGQSFVWILEPPVRLRLNSPRSARPRTAPPLAESFTGFLSSQADVREFLREYADLDLASIRFRNPFVRGIRFSLATGLHVITAHERRHLAQAWGVRRAIESAAEEPLR